MGIDKALHDIRAIPDKIRQHYLKKRIGKRWAAKGPESLLARQYDSYDDYVEHQAAKFKLKNICPREIDDYDQRYRALLLERLNQYGVVRTGTALCLGARQGSEVKAFIDKGCFAVGIDLNPGKDNRYVLPGDFHAIQFPDSSTDIVFSNSFDHAFDLTKLLGEIQRVLKPDGLLVLEAGTGMQEDGSAGFYECLQWSTVDQLVGILGGYGFRQECRHRIEFPNRGWHLVLRLES
ncbi:MAG: class I SAM-dependent methyltransferase [Pseudomonadota bacterium]